MHYAPETFKMWTLGPQYKNLFATQFCVKSILAKFESQKLPFLQFQRLSTLDFGKFVTWKIAQIDQKSKFRVSKIAKNDIFAPFEFGPKFDFT